MIMATTIEVREIWEVEMYKNIGTIEEPVMEWVTDKRFYYKHKNKNDYDLHNVEGLRRNAQLITYNP